MVLFLSFPEAVDAIMLYSPNPLQLLRRKKVKREHLYTYLAENKYIAPPSADKAGLIRKILELWGTNKVSCKLWLCFEVRSSTLKLGDCKTYL